MTSFIELITAYPAVVYTTLLLFCLVWLLVTTVLGGLGGHAGHHHGGHDFGHGHDLHVGHAGHGHGGQGGHGHGTHGHGSGESHPHGQGQGDAKGGGPVVGITSLPPAISFSMISFAGWVVTVATTAGLRAAEVDGPALWAGGAVSMVVGFYAGVVVTRPLARAMAPLFATSLAPSEDDVVGSYAKVRSIELDDDDLGEPGRVVVTTGPLRSAAFRAKSVRGKRFPNGATVFVVDADRVDGRLVVYCDDPHPELAP